MCSEYVTAKLRFFLYEFQKVATETRNALKIQSMEVNTYSRSIFSKHLLLRILCISRVQEPGQYQITDPDPRMLQLQAFVKVMMDLGTYMNCNCNRLYRCFSCTGSN